MKILPPVSIEARRLLPSRWDVLAAILVVGGVIGAQFGVRAGARLRGEQIRLLLALLVLAVAFRLLWGLVVKPADFYSIVGS